mgnify:CR=1 FL=1
MKSNTGLLKNSLHQALINAPDDFSLQEVKILIVRALDIVESVEKKRNIRETSVQKRKEASVAQKKEFFNSLKAIENEIAIVPITFPDNWKLLHVEKKFWGRPGIARAIVHAPIETKGMQLTQQNELRERVYNIISDTLKKLS